MQFCCRFLKTQNDYSDLGILHFVLENKKEDGIWKSNSCFRMHLILDGAMTLSGANTKQRLCRGDAFLTSPGALYSIEGDEGLRYTYIGFTGMRAGSLTDAVNAYGGVHAFLNLEELLPLWENAILLPNESLHLGAEGALLTTFAKISATRHLKTNEKIKNTTVGLLKRYVEEHFADPALSLDTAARELAYNKNYLSTILKREMKTSFRAYLNLLRVQNACALIDEGFRGIRDIAFLSGFNDPLYFSKVFKKEMGVTPSELIASKISELKE